jgi:hypothetical protein
MVTKTLQIACYLLIVISRFLRYGATGSNVSDNRTASIFSAVQKTDFSLTFLDSQEYGGKTFLRNADIWTPLYMVSHSRIGKSLTPMSEPEISHKRFIYRIKLPLSAFILYTRATCVVQTIHERLSHFSVSSAISALPNHKKFPFVQDRSTKFTNSTHAHRGNSKLLALLACTGSVKRSTAGRKFDTPISSSDIMDYYLHRYTVHH